MRRTSFDDEAAFDAGVAAERERCAKCAENGMEYEGDDLPRAIDRLEYSHQFARNQLRKKIAAAIRKG